LSKLFLLRQFLAHVYFSKFPITRVFHILYTIRDREPAQVLIVQQASSLCTHNHRMQLCRETLDFLKITVAARGGCEVGQSHRAATCRGRHFDKAA